MFLSNSARQGPHLFLILSFLPFLSRARFEDAERTSELETAKKSAAWKFWHEAAPSKHNLALDKRKRRANKKGGEGGKGRRPTGRPQLSLCLCPVRPPNAVPVASYYLGRSVVERATKPSPSMAAATATARLAVACNCRPPRVHSYARAARRDARTPSLTEVSASEFGSILLHLSSSAILLGRPDARACLDSRVSSFCGVGRSVAVGRSVGSTSNGQKKSQFTIFHKFSRNAVATPLHSTPLHSGLRSKSRKWDAVAATVAVAVGAVATAVGALSS